MRLKNGKKICISKVRLDKVPREQALSARLADNSEWVIDTRLRNVVIEHDNRHIIVDLWVVDHLCAEVDVLLEKSAMVQLGMTLTTFGGCKLWHTVAQESGVSHSSVTERRSFCLGS